jgi:hypothetical protein
LILHALVRPASLLVFLEECQHPVGKSLTFVPQDMHSFLFPVQSLEDKRRLPALVRLTPILNSTPTTHPPLRPRRTPALR